MPGSTASSDAHTAEQSSKAAIRSAVHGQQDVTIEGITLDLGRRGQPAAVLPGPSLLVLRFVVGHPAKRGKILLATPQFDDVKVWIAVEHGDVTIASERHWPSSDVDPVLPERRDRAPFRLAAQGDVRVPRIPPPRFCC